MNEQQTHIIHKVVLELNLTGESKAVYFLQESVKNRLKEAVIPQLEQFLTQQLPQETWISVPSLKIDLGEVSQSTFMREFHKLCLTSLKDQLSPILAKQQRIGEPVSKKSPGNGEQEGILPLSSQAPTQQIYVEQFFQFLTKGQLPFWVSSWEEWEEQVGIALHQEPPQVLKEIMRKQIPESSQQFQRLTEQFSYVFLSKLTTHLSPNSPKHSTEKALSQVKELQWILEHSSSSRVSVPKGSPTKQAQRIWKKSKLKKEDILSSTKAPTSNESSFSLKEELSKKEIFLSKIEKEMRPEFHLRNAGLSLILSCLHPLFSALDYLDEGRRFQTQKIQHRACHLLQFLACGGEREAEPFLILNKLVCGIPLEETLPRNLTLSKQEKAEGESFLTAMLEHWKVLKNTSVEGLRHNFLMREGKLEDKGSHWLLKVQPESFDKYLLAKLPWSISMVKYKWMPKHIQVEWV